jgi:hypothetical protein
MFGLPADLRPPLERTLVKTEAAFRKKVCRPALPTWQTIHEAIETTMLESFRGFAKQSCAAVEAGNLTVSDARSHAESFLECRAEQIYEWLTPVVEDKYLSGCPFRFHRYDSEKRFLFRRDITESVRQSKSWRGFLTGLSTSSERPGAVSRSETAASKIDKLPKRAKWLRDQMEKRDRMSINRLHELSNVDRKTIKRVLNGEPVTDKILEKLAAGLSEDGCPRVERSHFPNH